MSPQEHRHHWENLRGSLRCDDCGAWIGDTLNQISLIAHGLRADDFEDDDAAIAEIARLAGTPRTP